MAMRKGSWLFHGEADEDDVQRFFLLRGDARGNNAVINKGKT